MVRGAARSIVVCKFGGLRTCHRNCLIKKYALPAPLAAALAANAEMESGVDTSVTQSGKNGKGHGLFQLTDPARKASFKQFNGGKGIDEYNADQQIKYQLYELAHSEQRKFALAQRVGSDAASLAAGYSNYVIRPKENFGDSADRYAVARALDKIPIK